MSENSDIANWFAGKSVFITGATGFLGKVLIEKLLRSCPDVGPIYVLVRRKKGCESHDRIKELIGSNIFNHVKNTLGDLTTRIHAIPGDLSKPYLGIRQEDREILEKTVSVVFHTAATVRFKERLRLAVTLNVAATKILMELCCGMEKLEAVIHVSTAYANSTHKIIEERIYEAPVDVQKSLQWVDDFDDDILDIVTPRLLKNHPNTYTFTKALAEQVVNGYAKKLPVAIVRPSIVTGSWKEPEPGWIDSINGPATLILCAKHGFVHSLPLSGNHIADLIPIDVCVNLMITAAWQAGNGRNYETEIPIYNNVSGPFNSITWGQFIENINACNCRYGFSNGFFTPKLRLSPSRLQHFLRWNIFQYMLVNIMDLFAWSIRKKPIFRSTHKKISIYLQNVEYFFKGQWIFRINNVDDLYKKLSPSDQRIFDFNVRNINWKEYINLYVLGIRKHIMKENEESIPATQRKNIILKTLSRLIMYSVLISSGYFAFNYYIPNIPLSAFH